MPVEQSTPPTDATPDTNTGIAIERVAAAFQQIPIAAVVTMANGATVFAVLSAAGHGEGVAAWLALSVAVAGLRLALWWLHRAPSPAVGDLARWSWISVCGALAAGAVWGGGAVVLYPQSHTFQLFWTFVIAGMCAGAAALHYTHLPSTLAFILPAGAPLAVRLALEGGSQRNAASAMIALFLVVMVITACRSSRYFGETVRLRLDLARRTRELDASNTRLRQEMAERQATEASLRHAQKMEAVGQLTGGIAHDFNNLLTAVLGSLSLLRKHLPPGDPRADRLLGTAIQGADRGAALTQRLLAFGRRQPLRPETVQLQAIVPGMSALLRSSLGAQVQVALRFDPALPAVEVDAGQLELALLNLVVNARDAMPEGGQITLSARTEGAGHVVLTVADTGEGMDDATLSRAMEPFFTTKGAGKGTGLGLAMVHGFAAQSGGKLVLHSTPGTGTVAELWLPLAIRARAQASPAAPAAPADAPPSRPCRVLVVDDDPLVLSSTLSMLEDLGHGASGVASGAEALALLAQDAGFDLVVTDFAMPGMTGLQLAEELRRRLPRLPVLLATGFAELPDSSNLALMRLRKPYGQDALARAIDSCVTAVRPA